MRKIVSITLTFVLLLTTLCLPTFASAKPQLSDVNLDGEVSIVDAKWILQSIVGLRTLTKEQNVNADVNKDNELSIVDAKWVLQIIVGLREVDENGNATEVIPETKPTENQYAYFTASTGEKIRYCTYSTLDGARSTGVHESNGKVTVTYDNGTSNEWFKCNVCGKYLCEGCKPQSDKCPYCGKVTCERQGNDGNCVFCGQFVKGDTCHDCPNSPRR